MKTALLVALFPAASLAGTVVLEPVKDATLYEDPDASEEQALANGSGGFLFIGRTDQPPNPLSPTPSPVQGLLRRTLLKFEVPSAVPTEAIILDAKLELTVTNIPQSITSDDRDATLHRVLADWVEGPSDPDDPEGIGAIVGDGEATWTHRISGTSAWATPGGDFVPDASATEVVSENFTRYSWEGIGMLEDVRAWISGVAENHGWIMLGDEAVPKTARRFNSRTNSTFPVTFRPSLTIDFLFPTEILASTVQPDGSVEVEFTTVTGQSYSVETGTDLGSWTPLPPLTGDGSPKTVVVPPPAAGNRLFLRVAVSD